jgi:hypothetical protein
MPLLPILVAAAALAAPAPDAEALALKLLPGVQLPGTIMVDLFVGPDGTILGCDVAYSERSKADGETYCRNAVGQKVTKPATGPDGAAAYGVLRFGRVAQQAVRAPDLELQVASLPAPYTSRMRVPTVAWVDPAGKLAGCEPDPGALAAYGKVACQQLQQVPLTVRHDAKGQAVPYVARLDVDFVTGG